MAERVQIKGFVGFTIVMTGLIYPVGVFACWSKSGFLKYINDQGEFESIFGASFVDFAGSGVVHMVGGVAALCGALVVGPRSARFDEGADSTEFLPHNIPFLVLGTFCLWVGWFGFNPGSTMAMHKVSDATTAGLAAVNSVVAPCISGLVVFFMKGQVVRPKRLDVGAFCNGILSGLVAITAGCSILRPWEAGLVGFVAAFVYLGAARLLQRMRIDDVVDAFAVHGASGFWGIIAVGLLGNPREANGGNGSFYGGDQFVTQLLGALCLIAWTVVLSLVVLLPLQKLGALRLSEGFQVAGADIMEHSPAKAYASGTPAGSESSSEISPTKTYNAAVPWQC